LELKESLRRRRNELIAKIDNIDDGPNLQNDDAGDLDARKEELIRLGQSIAGLDSRIERKLQEPEHNTSPDKRRARARDGGDRHRG
jgi:hypothetical protein